MNLSGFFDLQASPSGWFSDLAQVDGWFNAAIMSDVSFRQWAVANKNGVAMDNITALGIVAIDSVASVNGILL